MSAEVHEPVPPVECDHPPSRLSDVNDAGSNNKLQLKPRVAKTNNDDGPSPPEGADNTVHPVSSSEDSTGRSSLAHILQSLAPQVSLVLENTGSVARDHLANERTWLAYVRTSLSIAGTGVALVQLFTLSQSTAQTDMLFGTSVSLRHFARPLGATTVLLALCILGIGVLRFFKVQAAMVQGQFPAARSTIVIITATLAALVAVTFGILVGLPS